MSDLHDNFGEVDAAAGARDVGRQHRMTSRAMILAPLPGLPAATAAVLARLPMLVMLTGGTA